MQCHKLVTICVGVFFLGSLIFGLVNAFGILVAPRLAVAFGFILMIIVLIIRPWGLMGKPE